MEARKLAIISGLYANTNLDSKENSRAKAIKEIEDNFRQAIVELYNPSDKEENIKDNPFFEAIEVPGGDIDWTKAPKANFTDMDEDIDQTGD